MEWPFRSIPCAKKVEMGRSNEGVMQCDIRLALQIKVKMSMPYAGRSTHKPSLAARTYAHIEEPKQI